MWNNCWFARSLLRVNIQAPALKPDWDVQSWLAELPPGGDAVAGPDQKRLLGEEQVVEVVFLGNRVYCCGCFERGRRLF